MSSQLRIGTRGSDLALWQARRVAELLRLHARTDAELVIVHTSGDRDRSRALHELPGSGFFTKELQNALLVAEVDLVVHSLKDLPTDEPEGVAVAAVLEREDPRELLLHRPGAAGDGGMGLTRGARLGTSSLRRAAQALARQPDLVIQPLRGNVPTRVRKLREGTCDAVLLAAAGVGRLGLDLGGLAARTLAIEEFLPAPGQGALAIEVRAGDARARDAVAPLHEAGVAEVTDCERALLKGLGGGCHLPFGAFAKRDGDGLELRAVLGELDAESSRATLRQTLVRGADSAVTAAAALADLRGIRAP